MLIDLKELILLKAPCYQGNVQSQYKSYQNINGSFAELEQIRNTKDPR